MRMNKKDLSERGICSKYISSAIIKAKDNKHVIGVGMQEAFFRCS